MRRSLRERVQRIATGGCPNYFGEQRFGREAGNLEQVLRTAQQLAEGGRERSQSGAAVTMPASCCRRRAA